MPYIDQPARERLDNGGNAENPGELTYVIYKACLDYLLNKSYRFSTFAEIGGALSSADQEFYRRFVVPYEEGKIRENGDV